jgi:Yip1 domain
MATTTIPNTFLQRLIGAAALDTAIYEEVEADRGATAQAMAVVVLSSLAGGFGARGLGGTTPSNIAFFTLISLMAWAAWALVTYQIGGRLMPEPQTRVDVGELLRTTGFASAPGLLRLFGVLPGVTIPAFAIAAVWMLAAMVVAVRQALDYKSTARTIAVCVIGWALGIAFAVGIGLAVGTKVS